MSPGVYPTFMHKKKLSRKNSKSHTTNKPRLNYLDIWAVENVENKRFNRRGPRRKNAENRGVYRVEHLRLISILSIILLCGPLRIPLRFSAVKKDFLDISYLDLVLKNKIREYWIYLRKNLKWKRYL